MGDEKNTVKAGFSYIVLLFGIIGLIIDVIIYYTSKDKYSKFHSAQASFLLVALTVITLVISWLLSASGISAGMIGSFVIMGGIGMLVMLLYIILAVLAFLGKDFEIPVIAKIVKK